MIISATAFLEHFSVCKTTSIQSISDFGSKSLCIVQFEFRHSLFLNTLRFILKGLTWEVWPADFPSRDNYPCDCCRSKASRHQRWHRKQYMHTHRCKIHQVSCWMQPLQKERTWEDHNQMSNGRHLKPSLHKQISVRQDCMYRIIRRLQKLS